MSISIIIKSHKLITNGHGGVKYMSGAVAGAGVGYGGGFALIVVLFILLIIVGAAFVGGVY